MAWAKGESGNLSGRRRSNWRKIFDAAIDADTEKHGQSIFEYAIAEARNDNTLLAVILKKCLPDLKQVESMVDVGIKGYALLTPSQACAEMDEASNPREEKREEKRESQTGDDEKEGEEKA